MNGGGGTPVTDTVRRLLDSCTTTCQLLAEQDEGPYHRDEPPRRSDITEDRPGSPLRLGLRFRTASGQPVSGADVEVWHCDAGGRYSGYPPPAGTDDDVDRPPQSAHDLPEETFLRGRQSTDATGDVEFRTIYPGWYPGRTVHIHLMVHTESRTYTSQLYFPEGLTAMVFAHDPYRDHGLPDTTHATDSVFAAGGPPAVLEIHPAPGSTAEHDARSEAEGELDVGGHVGVVCLVVA